MNSKVLIAFFASFCINVSAQEKLIYFDQIQISNIPIKSENLYPWDSFSNPDLRVVLYDTLGNIIYESETIPDIKIDSFPIILTVEGINLLKISGIAYKIKIFDEDLTKYELIDETELFSFEMLSYETDFSVNTKKYNTISLRIIEYRAME